MQREKPATIAGASLPGRHETRPAAEWIALSDLPPQSGMSGALSHGLFICEVALPPGAHALLLDWQPDSQPKRTFSVYLDAGRGLSLLQRQGAGVQRKTLPGPLPGDRGTARILYGWNQQADRWFLSYAQIDTQTELRVDGRGPILPTMEDLAAICRSDGGGLRHPALLWFGITQGEAPPRHAPWIGPRTPIDTARGPVAAGNLRPGDMVITADRGLLPVRHVTRQVLPGRGSFAPVILRAPFLGQGCDILASADQPVALSGPEVEYMFGTEEVLLPLGALADGRMARAETGRSLVEGVAIDLGAPRLLLADGLPLLSHGTQGPLPRPLLAPWEAQQLVTLLSRRSRHGATRR